MTTKFIFILKVLYFCDSRDQHNKFGASYAKDFNLWGYDKSKHIAQTLPKFMRELCN